MMKILYVDTPFQNLQGGDKNRSNFIWSCLSEEFEADLLLIKTKAYASKAVEEHHGYHNLFTIGTMTASYHQPKAIYHFHPRQLAKFKDIVLKGQYDIIVFRFLSTYHLAYMVSKILPQCRVVVDVDMLFSRVAALAWAQNPCLKNRYNLIEMLKLKAFEKTAFKQSFLYYFTNPVERDIAVNEYDLDADIAHVFPNMMQLEEPIAYNSHNGKYILFFGTMSSVANQDAFRYFVTEIYPSIESQLRRAGIQIWVVGKNPPEYFDRYHDDCLRIVGEVDDMQEFIYNSEFVILPIRIASGTRTRILEAAQMRKAVLTTGIGMEGFLFSNKEIVLKETAAEFATAMLDLIENKETRDALGKNLYHAARAKYGAKALSDRFIKSIKRASKQGPGRRLKIALITNRFYPEVGGAETNIYYQARELSKNHEVTVFCPKRIERQSLEHVEGFRVLRMWDVLNNPKEYPNLRSKTLCPLLIVHILFSNYDIIQCFPAINYNNIIAYVAAKIKKIPYILCFFDFLDYASIIKEQGFVDKNILEKTSVRWYQKIILQGMNQGFAISEKELHFLKKYNPKIDFSPVPVLSNEFDADIDKPPLMNTWTGDHFVFLCLGRISHIKGQDIALEAFCSVADQMPTAKIVFVGRSDYEAEYLENLKTTMLKANLMDRVHFTGMVERKEVLAWLKYSDLNIIPVRFMNSGAVVVESWISDTPVLQSDVVDPNLVEEGKNGWLFESENVDDCAAKMLVAYHNHKELPQMAALGKEKVLKSHTYENLIELYQQSYYNLLGK